MATITGKLESVTNLAVELGAVEVQLCGYGGQVPRYNGIALIARITDDDIVVAPAGTFSFSVPGNDQIAPAGTYYTVTIKDDNGDIAQINAYRFLSNPGNYDLNLFPPYDPNQDPPPLPPLITNLLLIIPAAASMNFPGDVYTAFKTTLPGDVFYPTISGMVPGNLYTFIIVQDGTGGHGFIWPANVHNATTPSLNASSTSIQTFVADENGDLWAIGPGTRA